MTEEQIKAPVLAEGAEPIKPPSIWLTWFMIAFLMLVPSLIISAVFGFYAHFAEVKNVSQWFSLVEVQMTLMFCSLPVSGYLALLMAGIGQPAIKNISSVLKYLHVQQCTPKEAVKWIGITILVWFAISLFGYLADLPEEPFMLMVKESNTSPFVLIVVICIFAPIVEELIFRGLAFVRFEQTRLATSGAALMTCFAFILIHAQQYTLAGLFVIGIIAVYLTFIRVHTGNTSLSIIAHATNNILSTIALYFWI